MKQGRCQICRKPVGMVPDDATDITCFKCDNEVAKNYAKLDAAMRPLLDAMSPKKQ